MDRQTKELDEKIRVMSDELTQIEGELEDQQVGTLSVIME